MDENRWVFLGWKKNYLLGPHNSTYIHGYRLHLVLSCLVFGEVGSYWALQWGSWIIHASPMPVLFHFLFTSSFFSCPMSSSHESRKLHLQHYNKVCFLFFEPNKIQKMYIPLKQENFFTKNIYTPKRNFNRKTTISSNFPTTHPTNVTLGFANPNTPDRRRKVRIEKSKFRLGPSTRTGPLALEMHQIHQSLVGGFNHFEKN